jgi:hypothetical protein
VWVGVILRRVHLVVDNSTGGDELLASKLADVLRARGYAVEVRKPRPEGMFDTSVNLVSAGIVLRADERPHRAELSDIAEAVRAALTSHPSQRRRTSAVPFTHGEGGRVLTWIDAFD